MKYLVLITLFSLLTVQTSWGCFDPNVVTLSLNDDVVVTGTGIKSIKANQFNFYSEILKMGVDNTVMIDATDSSGNKTHQLVISAGEKGAIIVTIIDIKTADVRVFKGTGIVSKGGCNNLDTLW